jgi:hypothetical protein
MNFPLPRGGFLRRALTARAAAISGLALPGLLLSGLALSGCRPADRDRIATRGAGGPAGPDSASVRRDVVYLASDALEGRGTGTAGNDSAAAYVARRFAALGLEPPVVTSDAAVCAPARSVARAHALGQPGAAAGHGSGDRGAAARCASYLQPFTAHSVALAHAGRNAALRTQNVVALLPGTDPALRGEYVVVGAHFDHLGRSSESAQDPEARDAIRNGADDNASGTAAVLELARLLARRPVRRSVLFVTFSGEELGLLGSQYFVEHAPVSIDSVQAMLNFDMVGRLRDGKLLVYGVATSPELPRVVAAANAAGAPPLAITAIGDGFGPSDHSSFFAKNVPVLHFFTDLHDDYHRATDDAEKINAAGEAQVIALAERVVRDLGDRAARLPFQRTAQPPLTMGPRDGSSVYFGSVPDMTATDVEGLRVSGVRPGSPADRAGLQGGDVIVEFAGTPVKDLYEYSDALYARKPGDVVHVVVVRNGQRVTLTATLGKRGG